MSKVYTADALRRMEATLASGDVGRRTRDEVASMLSYAAGVLERLYECYDDLYVVGAIEYNYILRGDVGKRMNENELRIYW